MTDRHQLPDGAGLVSTLGRCSEAGLSHVVLRELDLDREQRTRWVAELTALGLAVVTAHGALVGAWGAHLAAGQDPSAAGARPFGQSCHDRAEVASAAGRGAGWVTLSPFAATASKPGYGPPLPEQAYAGHGLPVYALGGITPDNASSALAAGAHGVAVMGEVMRAADPGAVVRALLDELGVASC
ncbi:thiamine phosphate synthase [Aeromicrobium sp. Sec7.5]|uniref:thiamine phosphate synthase n=1 Tax=Aeromicrobium sp. Sec7.5 TaxID=3121276 RepID=UPI002FE4D744